jgi:hypothetical protein
LSRAQAGRAVHRVQALPSTSSHQRRLPRNAPGAARLQLQPAGGRLARVGHRHWAPQRTHQRAMARPEAPSPGPGCSGLAGHPSPGATGSAAAGGLSGVGRAMGSGARPLRQRCAPQNRPQPRRQRPGPCPGSRLQRPSTAAHARGRLDRTATHQRCAWRSLNPQAACKGVASGWAGQWGRLRSSQFQGGQAHQAQQHGDDPEAHDHLRFLPAALFEVVVQRRHLEQAPAFAVSGFLVYLK